MAETKKSITFKVGLLVVDNNLEGKSIDITAFPYNGSRDFKLEISEFPNFIEASTDKRTMRVELGKVFGGLNSLMDYIMDYLNEPPYFSIYVNGSHEGYRYDYKGLHAWIFNALQGLLL